MKKLLLSLAVLLAIVLIPTAVSSKSNTPDTITLTKDNLLTLSGEVNGDSVGPIILKAKEMDAKLSGKLHLNHSDPLYLYLNTPGGSIQSGLELIEVLKGLGRPVHTVTAFAASMGFQIAENLDNRYVLKSGILMSHRAAGQFAGSFGGTSPSQLDSRVRIWTQVTKEMDETVVARTNGKQTLESYQKAYSPELWNTGQEAVAAGYADQVVKVKCGENLTGTIKHQIEFMGFPIEYETDACPINTSPMNVKITPIPGSSMEFMNKVKEQFLSGIEMKSHTALPLVW